MSRSVDDPTADFFASLREQGARSLYVSDSSSTATFRIEPEHYGATPIVVSDVVLFAEAVERVPSLTALSARRLALHSVLEKILSGLGANLEYLKLDQCGLDDSDIIGSAPALGNLNTLSLVRVDVGDPAIGALEGLTRLKDLRLFACQVSDKSGEYIGQCFSQLERLTVFPRTEERRRKDQAFTEVGVANVVNTCSNLKRLSFAYYKIGDPGAKHIAAAQLSNLEHLDLGHCGISSHGVNHLSAVPWPNLRYLNISRAQLDKDGAAALARIFGTGLEQLEVVASGIDHHDMEVLASVDLSGVVRLSLNGNPLGDLGARALFSADLSSLESISLSECGIGAAGAEAIAKNLPPSLKTLNMQYNAIDERTSKLLTDASEEAGVEVSVR